MQSIELLRLFKAIEFLYNGIDISTLTEKDFKKFCNTDKLEDTCTGNFIIAFDANSKKLLEFFNPYILREENTFYSISKDYLKEKGLKENLKVSYANLIQTIKILIELGFCEFNSLDKEALFPEYLKELEEKQKKHDYSKALDCPIKSDMTIEKLGKEFNVLLALADYPETLRDRLYEYYYAKHDFILTNFKDFEVVDNRIIIPLSEKDIYDFKKYAKDKKVSISDATISAKAIVVSKNILDYFYCSYGNAFQSCFALNSPMMCWHGYLPYGMVPGNFIVYATTGDVMKTGIISGSKFHNPQMIWRAWGYADANGCLLLDKKYRQSTEETNTFISFCCELLHKKFGVICDRASDNEERALYNNGKDIYEIWSTYKLRFYSDSLRRISSKKTVYFEYAAGCNPDDVYYKPSWRDKYSGKFSEYAKTVTSFSDDFNPLKPFAIEKGFLYNYKICPITQLHIDNSEDKHVYAKYFTEPVKNLIVLDYMDGFVFIEDSSNAVGIHSSNFDISSTTVGATCRIEKGHYYIYNINNRNNLRGGINLKSLKENIKGSIKDFEDFSVLLKIIEKEKINFQVFKNIKKDS